MNALRVLFVEDDPLDVELAVLELKKNHYDPDWRRVDTAEAFTRELADNPPDVIISDHAMPQFSSSEALTLLQARGLSIPFVVVSHAIGEEEAVGLMRKGADDFLMKDRLGRLGQAIRHALEQQRLKDEHGAAQQAILRLNQELERRIDQRTAELQAAKRSVEIELESRKKAEEALRQLNAELEARVEKRTRDIVASQHRLRALTSELTLAEQRERKRLAVELHDYLAQLLVLAKLKLGQGKRLAEPMPTCAEMIKQTDEVLTEALTYTRTLVHDLSPSVLHEFGLAAAIRWLADRMRRHDLAVTVFLEWNEDVNLAEDRAVLLFQSVRELLMNAAKHAKSGKAAVRLELRDRKVWIEVRDEGAGFDVDAAAAVGEHDAADTLSSKFGLFSIRERMKALGGTFDLESAPGRGTTATLSLPLKTRDGREALGRQDSTARLPDFELRTSNREPSTSPVSPGASRRIRVLLVDDHAMVREGLRSVLETYADVEVVGEALDGEEAVSFVDQFQPSVVVMDINMPKMNGIEATALIKVRHPHVVVIGLSVNASGENQHAMKTAGAAVLLTKEAAVDDLYQTILQAFSENRAIRV